MKTSGSAERWGPRWGARPQDWSKTEEQQLATYEEAIRRAGVGSGQRVLDVGCGTGVFLRAAADRGAQVFGPDASEALLDVAPPKRTRRGRSSGHSLRIAPRAAAIGSRTSGTT
jgi:cyclopropane fatty-acyl-phospholipid synthase-like methyltransferase